MRTSLGLAALLIASAGLMLTASRAEAGLIPTNVSITPDSGNFRWTYAVVVTTDVQVSPGDFFTIYDFGGMVPLSPIVAPLGWTPSVAFTTPPPGGTGPIDNPAIENITFKYEGTEPIVGQQGLGNFMMNSMYGESTTSDFTSITHRQVDGRTEANITATDVPVPGNPPNDTPEPATLAMFGIGLPVLGMFRYLRMRFRKK
jgi:hypothetical protein